MRAELTPTTVVEPQSLVEVLPPPSAATFQELLAALRTGATEARAEAARELRHYAPECLDPLYNALKDSEEPVRSAAAESLGLIGDERSVKPLVEALRAGFPGKSARRNRIGGLLLAITLPLVVVGAVAVLIATKGEGAGDMLVNGLTFGPGSGHFKSHNTRVIAQALTKIAERTPTPELRDALPDLQEIVADPIQQDKRSRAASRAAARKIQALTAKLDALPVTATTPELTGSTLPRPAGGSEVNVGGPSKS